MIVWFLRCCALVFLKCVPTCQSRQCVLLCRQVSSVSQLQKQSKHKELLYMRFIVRMENEEVFSITAAYVLLTS